MPLDPLARALRSSRGAIDRPLEEEEIAVYVPAVFRPARME
jgi:hypothetical protein